MISKSARQNQSSARAKPTAIDLFSGAGGLTLGLTQAGFDVLAGVEIDAIAASTFRMNHPNVQLFEKDIRQIALRDLMKQLGLRPGQLDLLAGCPPCQGFSSLRTRKQATSISDPRNELLFQYLRFVEGLQPKAIMLENVPSLLADQRMRILLRSLRRLGYRVGRHSARVEDAADFGVPQRRRRLILQATKAEVVPVVVHGSRITVRECFATANLAEVGLSGDPLHDHQAKRTPRVQEMIRLIPKDGGSRSALPAHLTLRCHQGKDSGFRDVYGRLAWDAVAPTMTGGCGNPSKGRYLHPEADRAISLREAALLQGFPANYRFDLSAGRDKVALMIGNALPPEFIRRHAVLIGSLLREKDLANG